MHLFWIENWNCELQVSDPRANKVFYRPLSGDTDKQLCDRTLDDDYFSCDLGFLITWYKIGNLAVDQTRTNSFQMMIGCDLNYNDTDSPRCALMVVYGEMNYLQNVDGDTIIAGISGRNGRVLFLFFLFFAHNSNLWDIRTTRGEVVEVWTGWFRQKLAMIRQSRQKFAHDSNLYELVRVNAK